MPWVPPLIGLRRMRFALEDWTHSHQRAMEGATSLPRLAIHPQDCVSLCVCVCVCEDMTICPAVRAYLTRRTPPWAKAHFLPQLLHWSLDQDNFGIFSCDSAITRVWFSVFGQQMKLGCRVQHFVPDGNFPTFMGWISMRVCRRLCTREIEALWSPERPAAEPAGRHLRAKRVKCLTVTWWTVK